MKKLLTLLFIFYSSFAFCQITSVKTVIDSMLTASEAVKSARFTLYTVERLKNGKFFTTERLVKMQTSPKKIYFYSLTPDPGMEVIWKAGWNQGKMKISPSGFPYITFSMDPDGDLARDDSHHPVYHIGFDYLTDLMKYYKNIYKEHFYDYASISDTVWWENNACILLTFDINNFKVVNYTLASNESIKSLASRMRINDYSVFILNPQILHFNELKKGQTIKIPNFYNRKIVFYIDVKTKLPLKQLIYDEKGLYENYEMKDFILNPLFREADFSDTNPDYSF